MERKTFLKLGSLLGLGAVLPLRKAEATGRKLNSPNQTCILIPQEIAGPYPLDLSASAAMFRQDITEGNPGIPLNLILTVVDVNNNCAPIQNARVDVWHCNKDGYYSGYANQPGYLGTQNHLGQTFFRGIQMTDVNGQVEFLTIYPGWYQGRVTHIHFQVFLNSVLSATSQLAFPDSSNTSINASPLYSAHGQNPTTNAGDGVFADMSNTQYEMLAVIPNTSGGFDGEITIGIAVPTTGIVNLEPETGGQFKLKQNFPNPFSRITTIPFNLTIPALVSIDLYSMNGQHVLKVEEKLSSGDQTIILDRNENAKALLSGNYLFQITVENENGVFRQARVLTVE